MCLFALLSFLSDSEMLGDLPYPQPAEHCEGGELGYGEPTGRIIL